MFFKKNSISLLSNTVKKVRLTCFGRGLIFSVTVIDERDKKCDMKRDTVTASPRYSATAQHRDPTTRHCDSATINFFVK
jgi:hypothetical protein